MIIPINSQSFSPDINIIVMPSKTFKMNLKNGRISSSIDNSTSLAQSIYKILMTKRYTYPIYNWDYGVELDDLFGMPIAFVKVELERRIKEAISIDDRVLDVYNFSIDTLNKGELFVQFSVKSTFGEIDLQWEVKL